jgi:hypothetical protein
MRRGTDEGAAEEVDDTDGFDVLLFFLLFFV